MKICHTCNRTYEDGTLVFCLDDGTRLSVACDPRATPARALDGDRTAILPGGLRQTEPALSPPRSTTTASPPAAYQREKRGGNAWIIIISGLLVLVVVGLVLVAGFFLWKAGDKSNPEPERARVSTPIPADTNVPASPDRSAESQPTINPDLEWLDGVWSGEGYQTDTKTTWRARLTVAGDQYSIDYPDIPCRGRWELIDKNSREATFTEVITRGADRCDNNSHVMVEKVSASEISCRYTHRGGRTVIATAVLSRKGQ